MKMYAAGVTKKIKCLLIIRTKVNIKYGRMENFGISVIVCLMNINFRGKRDLGHV